jgi:biotin carboxyl carrier protein
MAFRHFKQEKNMNGQENKFELDDTLYETQFTKKFANRKKYVPRDNRKLFAVIPGTIRNIFVKEGQLVKLGEPLLVLEAMKMKNIIISNIDGKIKKIHVSISQSVAKNELMLELE